MECKGDLVETHDNIYAISSRFMSFADVSRRDYQRFLWGLVEIFGGWGLTKRNCDSKLAQLAIKSGIISISLSISISFRDLFYKFFIKFNILQNTQIY